MQITIKYFGLLAEVTQCSEEQINCSTNTVLELLDLLYKRFPELKEKDFQIAQNNNIVGLNSKLESSEIALLPPFSGG